MKMRILEAAMLATIGIGGAAAAETPSYTTIIEGFDWGPGVSALVLDLGRDVAAASVDKSDFLVLATRKDPADGSIIRTKRGGAIFARDSAGAREVTEAYISDSRGKRSRAAAGRFVALALKVGPEEELAAVFRWDNAAQLNRFVTIEHTIKLKGSLLAAGDGSEIAGFTCPPSACTSTSTLIADDFDTKGVCAYADPIYGEIVLHYASYAPAKDGKKHPLVIWLHGAGEGGSDPRLALLGNRVTALAADPIQKIFGGAYVLVPQSPIVWMNNGKESYPSDGSTQYAGALKACIDAYVVGNKDIDPKRVYIGGCSNGGFMTMKMILSYPLFFAAAFPVCEPYADDWISDAQIASVKGTPIWFTQAKTDTTVNAARGGYVLETYRRLVAAGAKNVHLSYWDKVEDLSGKYFKADGKTPYEYNGHWSWVYTLNNQCVEEIAGKRITIMEWLAAQSE